MLSCHERKISKIQFMKKLNGVKNVHESRDTFFNNPYDAETTPSK